jgi:hypothetical protein
MAALDSSRSTFPSRNLRLDAQTKNSKNLGPTRRLSTEVPGCRKVGLIRAPGQEGIDAARFDCVGTIRSTDRLSLPRCREPIRLRRAPITFQRCQEVQGPA